VISSKERVFSDIELSQLLQLINDSSVVFEGDYASLLSLEFGGVVLTNRPLRDEPASWSKLEATLLWIFDRQSQ